MTDDLRTLIAYRMEQAEDSLRAAALLLNEGLWRDVVNRAYYGAFYGASGFVGGESYWSGRDRDGCQAGYRILCGHESPSCVEIGLVEYRLDEALRRSVGDEV